MSNKNLPLSEISTSINKITDIYSLKRDQLIYLCLLKKLNTLGKVFVINVMNETITPTIIKI
jgi:hypothetical protein